MNLTKLSVSLQGVTFTVQLPKDLLIKIIILINYLGLDLMMSDANFKSYVKSFQMFQNFSLNPKMMMPLIF